MKGIKVKNGYRGKGLVTRNTHVKYESPICYGSKVMIKVKVFKMKVKGHSEGHTFWYQWNGLVTRNTNVKYESTICYGSEVMIKVKVFCHRSQRSRSG